MGAFRPLDAHGADHGAGLRELYNYATKASYPPRYHMWMGIKLLLVLHISASAILYAVRGSDEAKRNRTALSIAISGLIVDRDCRLPEVFVAAMTGYDALRTRAAWMDLSARGKIKLTGEDRARLLHAMTTNHIQQLTPGTGCYAFFLNDKGRVLADANVLCRPDYFLLDMEPETREPLYQHLDRFIIADDVTLEDVNGCHRDHRGGRSRSGGSAATRGRAIPEVDYSSAGLGRLGGCAAQLYRQPGILHLCAGVREGRR